MGNKGWKQAERAHAKDVGCRRIPVTGERHGADFSDGLVDYQLKVRGALPTWLFTWMSGITGRATPAGRIGALVLNRPRHPRADALVVVRWSDWVALHGDPARQLTETSPDRAVLDGSSALLDSVKGE